MRETIYGITNEERRIQCPHCNQLIVPKDKAEVDVKNQKELQELFDGDFFIYKCHHCGKGIEMKDGVKIIMNDGDTMIQYLGDVLNYAVCKKMFLTHKYYGLKKYRLVDSNEAFVEKVRIFYMGLDDRIVEIMKILKFLEMSNDDESFDANQILCWITDDRNLELRFLYDGKLIDSTVVDYVEYEELYNKLHEHAESTVTTNEDEIGVDMEWAKGYIYKYLS